MYLNLAYGYLCIGVAPFLIVWVLMTIDVLWCSWMLLVLSLGYSQGRGKEGINFTNFYIAVSLHQTSMSVTLQGLDTGD